MNDQTKPTTGVDAINAALAAERENVRQLKGFREIDAKCLSTAQEEIRRLREQLTAKDSEIDAWHSQFGTSQLSHAIAERDALYAAIAAATKPMVDALTKIQGATHPTSTYHGWVTDALAKVKEEK